MRAEGSEFVSLPAGRGYRIESPGADARVTPLLAGELKRVLEAFAHAAGFDEGRPVSVVFKPGIFGHHRVGRAADIYGVGGAGLDRWKERWDVAMARAAAADPTEGRRMVGRSVRTCWQPYTTMAGKGRRAFSATGFSRSVPEFTGGPGNTSAIAFDAHRDQFHVGK
jgi:hypothetical protein